MIGLRAAVLAGTILAVGTYLMRLAGPVIARRLRLRAAGLRWVNAATAVILTAVLVTSTLTDGHHVTRVARPAGVVVAVVLAARRTPFVIVIVAAATTTAAIRYFGG